MVFESIKPVVELLAKFGMTPGDILRSVPTIGMFALMIKWNTKIAIFTETNKHQFVFLGKEQEKTNVRVDDLTKRTGANESHIKDVKDDVKNIKDVFDKFKKGHDNA